MRLLLVADVAIGCATALLVLVQATLLARVIAGSFSGATLGELRLWLGLLLVAFAGRACLAWSFEAVGRLAATSVLSRLRLDLAARRLADQPAALDGAQSGELAAPSVRSRRPINSPVFGSISFTKLIFFAIRHTFCTFALARS